MRVEHAGLKVAALPKSSPMSQLALRMKRGNISLLFPQYILPYSKDAFFDGLPLATQEQTRSTRSVWASAAGSSEEW